MTAQPREWRYLDPQTGGVRPDWADRLPSERELLGQGVRFRPRWWQSRMPRTDWGDWLSDLPEANFRRGYRYIERADLLTGWDGTGDGAARPLLAGYVWGTGGSGFLVPRRARTFTRTPADEITARLADAFTLLRESGPGEAYASLTHGGANRINYLGPSFFTKALYAADARDGQPGQALIMDRFVAIGLNHLNGSSLSVNGPWSGQQYEAWLQFAHRHAARGTAAARADAVEWAVFTLGKELVEHRRFTRASG